MTIRPATEDDLPALTDLYNHYIAHTPITFDLQPFTVAERRQWFFEHSGGRYRLLVADDGNGRAVGITLPNPASVALHERCGFRQVGALSSVGRKFDRYWDVAWFERPLLLE